MLLFILSNLLWILLAYLIGSLNFSIILTKLKKHEDIKTKGSGNAGATNALRNYGFKFGFLVFLLDTSKAYWLGVTMGLLQRFTNSFSNLVPQFILIFCIIGHIFPVYFKFKGGKGAASELGMISSISLIVALVGTILFLIIVYGTKYVSLGSIIVPFIIAGLTFISPYFNGFYDSAIATSDPFWLTPCMLYIAAIIVLISHHKNIYNLIHHQERKISRKFFSTKKIKTQTIEAN